MKTFAFRLHSIYTKIQKLLTPRVVRPECAQTDAEAQPEHECVETRTPVGGSGHLDCAEVRNGGHEGRQAFSIAALQRREGRDKQCVRGLGFSDACRGNRLGFRVDFGLKQSLSVDSTGHQPARSMTLVIHKLIN